MFFQYLLTPYINIFNCWQGPFKNNMVKQALVISNKNKSQILEQKGIKSKIVLIFF